MRLLGTMILFVGLSLGSTQAQAQAQAPGKARSLDELLEQVQDQARQEARASAAREQAFVANKAEQAQKLQIIRAELQAQREKLERLSQRFDEQEKTLQTKQKELKSKTGDLGELFGVLRKIAGEASGLLDASLLSAQYPGHGEPVSKVAQSKALASQSEIEGMWRSVLWNMVKSGTVETFEGSYIEKNGSITKGEILRVGTFSAFADGAYLRFLPTKDEVKLIELARQPPATRRAQARELQDAPIAAALPVSIDPSRGSVVELLVQSPSWKERIAQGGVIGMIILALGALGLLIALERLGYLAFVGAKIQNQSQKPDRPRPSNPLGRLLLVVGRDPGLDAQALLLRLEEAMAQELPRLRRGLGVITLFATTAPLLGLLGTVTGMIATFQSITLFGNGDPKMMSGGISQALVTTELGLATSIPLMLLHALVSQRANKIAHKLDDICTKEVADRLDDAPSEEASA